MITYNNVLIQYRFRCISITYMIKILGHRKERYDIEFRVVQNCDVVSNKALISDGRSENFVLINTINWLYYIYIYIFSSISILFPSYRFETTMFETNWTDSSLLRHLPYVFLRPIWTNDTEETVIQKVSKYMKNITIRCNLIIVKIIIKQ